MQPLKDFLSDKADALDMGRRQTLEMVQVELDRLYPKQVKALTLKDGVLKLVTPSAAIASDIRLRQIEILERINSSIQDKILKLYVRIG